MSKMIDLTGERFGNLYVIERIDNSPKTISGYSETRWLCKCDCGNIVEVRRGSLLYDGKTNCGCIKKPHVMKHGFSHKRLHGIWGGMRQRCFNNKNVEYKNYGGRGITVCKEWTGKTGSKNFIEWALNNGYEDNLTIERIDVDGNYCPDNCKWIPFKEQAYNKTNTIKVSDLDEERSLSQYCKSHGKNYSTTYERIKKGIDLQSAFSDQDFRTLNSGKRKSIKCIYADGTCETFSSLRNCQKHTGISCKKINNMLETGSEYKGMVLLGGDSIG